jgi:hypothetical protein
MMMIVMMKQIGSWVKSILIPHVTLYRKDQFSPHLTGKNLWKIYELDEKWEVIRSRRAIIDNHFKRLDNFYRNSTQPNDKNDKLELRKQKIEEKLNLAQKRVDKAHKALESIQALLKLNYENQKHLILSEAVRNLETEKH